MANRYLPHVQILKNRHATDFKALLPTEPPVLRASYLNELLEKLDRDQERLEITHNRRKELSDLARSHLDNGVSYDRGEEVEAAMTRILMHRYANRVQHMTPSLFEEIDPEPTIPLKANSQVAEGAKIHLHHSYRRALHYGFDDLCDASNENAELFLQFSGALVSRMETLAIRNQAPALKAQVQEAVLVEKAKSIAQECLEVSMTPNARLGDGANAIGIPEFEISALLEKESELAVVLKHALANGAVSVRRDYGQGGKNWCLIELSGTVCLAHGLTFKRGGFLEKRISYLEEVMS